MSKIVSVKSELTVLRGMFNRRREIAGTLLTGVDSSHFHTEEAKEIYEYVISTIREEGELPKYKFVLEDPSLSKDARDFLRDSQALVTSLADAKKALRILNKYRIRRGLHRVAHHISNKLQESRYNLNELLDEVSSAVSAIRTTKSARNLFTHLGKGDNAEDVVQEVLYGELNDDLIPLGIEAFDEVNGGAFRGSLVIVAGNSGAGKSHIAVNTSKYQASHGYKVVVVPLEMSTAQMMSRYIANVTATDSLKINRKLLKKQEKDAVYKKFNRWRRKVKKRGGRLSLYKPDTDLSGEELVAGIATYGADVVVVDYVSLLGGVDGDDQWRKLSDICRFFKITAENNNQVWVVLAQVNDEGVLKFAKAMKDHADNMLRFTANEDEKETGYRRVVQDKSRNQSGHSFNIQIEAKFSRVKSVDSSYEEQESAPKGKSPKNLAAPDV